MAEAKPARTYNVRRLVVFLLVVVFISLLISRVVSITGIFNTVLLEPMLNFLVFTSRYFLGSFGIAIIVLTIVVRLLILPLTLRQLRSSKAMRTIQPQIKELQRRYANDQQKLGQEITKLYKEFGVNPLGCVFPTLVQFPIWIALYMAIVQALSYTPENLLGLAKQLYPPLVLQNSVPLKDHFLWMNLTRGNVGMALLEGVTLWIVIKMSSTPTADPQQQSINRVLPWAMPLIFAFFAFILPSGLCIYWVTSNIVSMPIQYRMAGWGTLTMPSLAFLRRGNTQAAAKPTAKTKNTLSTRQKAGKGVAPKQRVPKADGATSEKREAVGGDTISQGNKASDGERTGERKD